MHAQHACKPSRANSNNTVPGRMSAVSDISKACAPVHQQHNEHVHIIMMSWEDWVSNTAAAVTS